MVFETSPKEDIGVSLTVQGRSGNPGYIAGFPVLVGSKDPANDGAKLVYSDGFPITGADMLGKCITTAKAPDTFYTDFGNPILRFEENLIAGCSYPLTKAELESLCTDGANLLGEFDIFKNLD